MQSGFHQSFSYLHSSMDRFEEDCFATFDDYLSNLHSSMDRFEVPQQASMKRVLTIYIPVWIDLKQIL